jgi:hypothetical protein
MLNMILISSAVASSAKLTVISPMQSMSQSVFPRGEDGAAVFASDGEADIVGLEDGTWIKDV